MAPFLIFHGEPPIIPELLEEYRRSERFEPVSADDVLALHERLTADKMERVLSLSEP